MSEHETAGADETTGRRFPRRFLLSAGASVAALGVAEAVAPGAAAAPAGSAWVLGGNAAVATNGTNFLGPKNVAPLIFKTTPSRTPVERMRITPTGLVGISASTPTAMLDVRGSGSASGGATVRAVNASTLATAAGLLTSATKGSGVRAVSVDGVGVSSSSTNGVGVRAVSATSDGVSAQGGPSGNGIACNGYIGAHSTGAYAGVYATGASYGSVAMGTDATSYGSYASGGAVGAGCFGGTYGVYGQSGGGEGVRGSGATGVRGSGVSHGVIGVASDPNGASVWGTGSQYGVLGDGGRTAGVRGESGYVGVWAQAPTYGVFALATDTGTNQTYGVFAQASNASSFAVFAQGRVHVNGTLSKSAGSFKIDHPLDPERQWLSHSFVESPDMMNVYNGNVVLGAGGTATVQLPDYFTALNADYRYQLTTIGAHAPVYVASKVADNAFTIAGGTEGLEVSWQVTGIRQDDYAKAHPIVVETPKDATDRGTRSFVPAGSKARPMAAHPQAAGALPNTLPATNKAVALQAPRSQSGS